MVLHIDPQPQELYFVKHETLVNYYHQLDLKDIEIAELKSQVRFMSKMVKDIIKTDKLTKELI